MKDIAHIMQGLFLILLFFAGLTGVFFLGRGMAEPTQALDPVAAYCHGVADGYVLAREVNRPALVAAAIPIHEGDPAEYSASCIEVVNAGELPDYLRGPLEAETP